MMENSLAMSGNLGDLSKPQLMGMLEFILASQKFTEHEPFYKSLKNLGRDVLGCDHLVIGTCSTSVYSDPKNTTRCRDFDTLLTLETGAGDETKHLIDACDSVRQACTMNTNNCSSNSCKKNLNEQQQSRNAKVTLVCNNNKFASQPLCLASVVDPNETNGSVSESNFQIIQSLIPYVTDAFFRLGPYSLNPQSRNVAPTPISVRREISLTPREKEILSWTSKGKGCWETGSILGISERTVKFHLHNIYRKLDVMNRAQAITKAMEYALL